MELTSGFKLSNSRGVLAKVEHCLLSHEIEEKRYEEWSIYHNNVFSIKFYDRGDYLTFDMQYDLPLPRAAEMVSNLRTNYPQKLQKHQVPS